MYDTHYDCAANNINYHIELIYWSKSKQDWEAREYKLWHAFIL